MKLYKIGYFDCECGSVDTTLVNDYDYTEKQFADLISDLFIRVTVEAEHPDMIFEFGIEDIITILINEFDFSRQKTDVMCRFEWDSKINNLIKA